jgi:hypothetical protein
MPIALISSVLIYIVLIAIVLIYIVLYLLMLVNLRENAISFTTMCAYTRTVQWMDFPYMASTEAATLGAVRRYIQLRR